MEAERARVALMKRDMEGSRETKLDRKLVLGSQLPHKIVSLLFTFTYQKSKSTVSWGS